MRFLNEKQLGSAIKTLVTLCLLAALAKAHAQTWGLAEMARISAAEASGQVAAKPFIAEAQAAVAVGDGKSGAAAARAAVRAAITPMLTEQYRSMGLSAAAATLGSDRK